jgi:dolichol-phosphate mannosyltransferase
MKGGRASAFAIVGGIGFLVQLGVAWFLTDVLQLQYLIATVMATEMAIVQNFLCHARWTWADRTVAGDALVRRFLRFQLATGAVSLVGAAALTPLLVEAGHVQYLVASTLTVVVCALANFVGNDRIVFAVGNTDTHYSRSGMRSKLPRVPGSAHSA